MRGIHTETNSSIREREKSGQTPKHLALSTWPIQVLAGICTVPRDQDAKRQMFNAPGYGRVLTAARLGACAV